MTMRSNILAIEARLNAARVPVKRLLADVGISSSSWWRWKNDQSAAGLDVWERVEAVVRGYEGE